MVDTREGIIPVNIHSLFLWSNIFIYFTMINRDIKKKKSHKKTERSKSSTQANLLKK